MWREMPSECRWSYVHGDRHSPVYPDAAMEDKPDIRTNVSGRHGGKQCEGRDIHMIAMGETMKQVRGTSR